MKAITQDKVDKSVAQHKGSWIRFEGFGILDGLKQSPAKKRFYKIVGMDEEGLVIRKYRGKTNYVLPYSKWDQGCEIITDSSFRRLPVYGF